MSLHALKSGATGLTQYWTKLVSRVGVAARLVTLVAGWVGAFTNKIGTPTTIALISGAAVVLAGSAVAVAIVLISEQPQLVPRVDVQDRP